MSIAARFRTVLPDDRIFAGEGAQAFAIAGLAPQCVLFPETVDEISRCVRVADEAGLAIVPVGQGTQLAFGNVPQRYDLALSTRRLHRILAHEAADMTITVAAGATLAEVNAALEPARQHLPLDPPHPDQITIGALIATDVSGPLRLAHGKARDLLIGIQAVLADGTLIKGGGRVVKNVAGYDLMKLFTGSFGTLGTVVEATFKVRPRPEHEALLVISAADTAAAMGLALEVLAAPVAPLYVEALNPLAVAALGLGEGAAVLVGCGGTAQEVAIQDVRLHAVAGSRAVRTCAGDEATKLYHRLRDCPANLRAEPGLGCKLSLLPSQLSRALVEIEREGAGRGMRCAILSHVGSGVAHLHLTGSEAGVLAMADWMRTSVRAANGWTTFDEIPGALKRRIDTWGTDVPGLGLMRALKRELDPRARLSPGRFIGGI